MVYDTPPHELMLYHFAYPLHHAEHADLNAGQMLAVQHYRECVARLVRKRDSYRATVESVPRSAFGARRKVKPQHQEMIFDVTQAYFDQLYTTLSALASVQFRCGQVWAPNVPPTRSVERYIGWWKEFDDFLYQDEVIFALETARDYRTLTVHSQQKPVFDWKTVDHGPPANALSVILFGAASAAGNIPQGAVRNPDDATSWELPAPNMDYSLRAMLILSGLVFHTLAG